MMDMGRYGWTQDIVCMEKDSVHGHRIVCMDKDSIDLLFFRLIQ